MQGAGGEIGFGWALVIASVALASGALPACGSSQGSKTGAAGAGASSGGSASCAANAGASNSGAPASGGSPTNGGGTVSAGNAGAGGSLTTRPDPTTQVGACVLYAQLYCEKIAACRGEPPRNCLDAFQDCPDAFFSEGSVRTVESVLACGKQWAGFSCERMAKGEAPDCIQAGTKALGERCFFASQCSSLSCNRLAYETDGCGRCKPTAAVGEHCDGDIGCAGLTSCDVQTSTCKAFVQSDIALGATCTEYSSCVAGAYCDASGKCAAYPKPGEPCGKGLFCDYLHQQYCRSDNTCQQEPGPGMPCGQTADGYLCDEKSAECNLDASGGPTCVSLPKASEPCAGGHRCVAGTYCDAATPEDVGVCRAFADKGGACASAAACVAGLFCDDGRCQSHAAPEEPCSDGNTVCHANSMCDGKVCVPLGFKDTFAKACGK